MLAHPRTRDLLGRPLGTPITTDVNPGGAPEWKTSPVQHTNFVGAPPSRSRRARDVTRGGDGPRTGCGTQKSALLSTFYREVLMSVDAEDLVEIERAGRHCGVCRSGRQWRRFRVVRPSGGQPVVMCAACQARYRATPPAPAIPKAAPAPAPQPPPRSHVQRPRQHEDRLKRVLRELPRGEHSTGRIAKAAGLNHAKTVGRLRQLEASGEVTQVGKRWSTERPSTDLEGAFDRLQARTSNIRIVRDRSRVGRSAGP